MNNLQLCAKHNKHEYKSYLIIDFGNVSNEIIDLFENESSNLDFFFIKLSAYYGIQFYERDTLIVFDEVQQFPRARQLIKYLVKDGRYDYIETGSLLSLKRNVKDIIIPSEEEHIRLYPLDFEEFLWALGDKTTTPFLKLCFQEKKPLGQAMHRKVMIDFRQYILVGGMPQAVNEYVKSKNFANVDKIKKNILTLYRNDVSKFATGYENKVLMIFDDIPGQLSKKEKKYKISSIRKGARFRDYENAFMWLNDAMIVNSCYNCTDPNVGFALSSDFTTRKCYMADTGLLISQTFMDNDYTSNDLYKAVLFNRLNINEGMLMENVVAQILRTNGHKLYFYSRVDVDHRENHMEIDFVISDGRKIYPIEVKSSIYKKHSSLDKFKTKFGKRIGTSYILYQKDLMVRDGVVHLPIYMAMFL
ncbi:MULTISPECIES: ATP-binding protein [Bacillota]|uniref:DUF4143 domain-containing protein n=1 Tax=Amedibacillus hominis TaxID=2897776 RepID=A0ABS9R806_9FIRM|nr:MULTISPECIES: DUF4143 domain-containing protein [Bacillota]MCH4285744.1 DUF4143 domain-containing protein [Amedibacillus hominis]